MYNNRRLVLSIFWVIVGITLGVLSFMGIANSSLWSGMGGALIAVGVLQIIRNLRYRSNDEYKEKVDIEISDERNKYIRMKAWSWAGYLFVMIAAVGTIGFMITGKEELMMMVSGSICIMLIIYWVSYLILRKKY